MRVEESWTLLGAVRRGTWTCRRARYRAGETASVVADGAWTLHREESHGDVVGFLHTHPMGGLAPSSRDVRTMRAWCDALGKSLLCVIAMPDAIAGWRFDDFRSDGETLAKIQMIGKTRLIGVQRHGREVSSRAALPRGRSAGEGRGAARRVVRRGGRRIEPRG